jgi:hypothetical protein
MPSIYVIYRLVTLDRIKASVRKRYESGNGDQGLDHLFIAIEWVAEFARKFRSDIVDSHEAPPRNCATVAPKELRSANPGGQKS